MNNKELMLRSLRGLWVGDCLGNIGQLYNAHDILKALDEGLVKFGGDVINSTGQKFQLSDDTEEAIVLVNHLDKNGEIKQDELAMEWAKRYYERDSDGEIFGYGLMTRKVLKDIYEGVPWKEANQTKPKIEGPSFVDNLISNVASGKSLNNAMAEVNADLKRQMEKDSTLKIGSCGNGSVMRVAPLGAYFCDEPIEYVIEQATLSSQPTHCHPEGIAGAIAISLLSMKIVNEFGVSYSSNNLLDTDYLDCSHQELYQWLLQYVPKGQVWDGIEKASKLPLDISLPKLIEILGNGTHVTCQDTVPLCVFLTIRALSTCQIERMYEEVIIETCKCFGDVDTNCAIVGGMIGIVSPPPDKWVRYCSPMEGLLGEPLPEIKPTKHISGYDRNAMLDALNNTTPKKYSPDVIEMTDGFEISDDGLTFTASLDKMTDDEIIDKILKRGNYKL